MKKTTSLAPLALALAAGAALATAALAGPPIRTAPVGIQVQKTKIDPSKLHFAADLQIYSLGAKNSCPCQPAGVDAMLLPNLEVVVTSQTPGIQAAGTITVTYFDLMQGRSVTRSIPFSGLAQASRKTFSISNTPLLVRKSAGIRAEIRPAPPVQEKNPADNVRIIHQCMSSYVVQ
ncbi:hypothetical protein G3N55_06095 [Dissulfurirhabdus thermomarina]|uniref:DUF1573 domain-containing protein n=1 Tax=Dissulfurirhabdus thermomarina TaxID=1765737 RepID=A0A6N9TMA8_DISTH|nr:hypothetical protein [Dissulfurirhabdus thermomarina]NDY42412.1 hypothetical protein [Dissulfurirhabdus thermomarina]NMX23818.1 hypothetical protein [Dissulfurirhabdus thermomarina]